MSGLERSDAARIAGPGTLRNLSALNVRDFLEAAAREAPDETFLIQGDDYITYREFNRLVDRAARAWHDLGVCRGDRVAFMLENRPEFLYAWLGLAKIGAVLVAFNTRWQTAEVAGFLELTEPRFALVGGAYREVFARAAIASPIPCQEVLTLDGGPHRDFGALMARAEPLAPPVELSAADTISLVSTSGTTGRPKAVMQTHGNYVLTGEGYANWVGLRRGEHLYLCLPLFHINSQAYTLMGAIAARGAIALVERFSASRFWRDMATYDIGVFNYIGSMLAMLMKRDPSPEERRRHVRLTYGGPALPEPLRGQVEERFGLRVLSGMGMSESTFGLMEALDGERRSGALGKPRQHPDPRIVNEARVVDSEGRDVPDGEGGELIYRNPVTMKGYFRDPEQTAATIKGGWLYTGDLVRRDQDGFYYFIDRKKDIVRVRGENVASSEVEKILTEHPAVRDAAIVGVPSDLTDEEIAAFVVPREEMSVTEDELAAWCRERLASFKAPAHLWLVSSLPKTETLRTEKHRLRQLARDRLGTIRPETVAP